MTYYLVASLVIIIILSASMLHCFPASRKNESPQLFACHKVNSLEIIHRIGLAAI